MKRIKYFMIAFMAILAVGVIGVSAETYSDDFKTLTSDGNVTIKVSTLDDRFSLLSMHVNALATDNYWFDVQDCNEDTTSCQIMMKDYNENAILEQHEVTINYVENYSEEFEKLAPNGKLTITETFLEGDIFFIVGNTIEKFNNENNTNFKFDCGESNTECRVFRYTYEDPSALFDEAKMVEIVYEEKYSTEYQKLTKDGKLTVPHYTVNTLESDYFESLMNYLNKISTDDYTFYGNGCNEDNTICNIYGAGQDALAEHHNVQITYKETISDEFKKFADNFKITQSTLSQDKFQLILNSLNSYNEKNNMYVSLGNCNSDFSECLFSIDNETHNVKLTYKDEYSEGYQKLTKDGKVKVTSSDLDSNKLNLINTYLNKFNNINSSFGINPSECNEDYTVCTVMYSNEGNMEYHNITFTYEEEYSDIFKKLTKDGNLIVTSSTIHEDKRDIVSSEANKLNNDKYEFYVSRCNEDYTVCNVVLNKKEFDPEWGYQMSSEIERHNVNVKFKEEYSDKFKKLTSNNKLVVKSIRPKNNEEAEFFLTSYVGMFNFDKHYFYMGGCNEDYSVCDATLSNEYGIIESHKVNVSYAEVNKEVLNKVNSLIDALPKGKRFIIEDLELINYLVRTNYNAMTSNIDVENSVINYSSEIKNYFGNMTAKLDARAGGGNPFGSEAFGGFVVLYEDTVYGLLEHGGAAKNHVIYISDETENTTEAYIKAAQDRINKYLKNKDVKIVYGGKLSEDFDEGDYKDIVDTSKIRDEYYILMYGETQLEFLIAKDSSKINNDVVYASNDIMTNVEISANSSSVPLDTTIKVNEITKENNTYKELTDRLNVKEALIYDLKLYSYTTTEYISKLEDGTFSVAIPLTDELKNKELMAYYVKDDGTVEEYEVEIVDGKAVFNTDHFSIYTIAEKTEINETVPNTYDGVGSHIVTSIVSLLGLFGALLYLRKKKLN